MKFKVGDKVKFLNEPGGGIVSKIISSNMVNVAIEDGFDIPTMVKDLIIIENSGHASQMFDETFNVPLPEPTGQEENMPLERTSPLGRFISKGINDPGVYLAFVPQDQQWLVTGMLDIYIVNNTSFDILFSFFINENKGRYEGVDYGSILHKSKCLIESIQRESITQWNTGSIQILFHQDTLNQLLSPVSSDFNIKPIKFVDEKQYVASSFLEGKSILLLLTDTQYHKQDIEVKEDKKYEAAPGIEQKTKIAKEETLIEKHKTGPHEAVVDLHIGEIIENTSELNTHDMLSIQVGYFTKCIESAMVNHYRKVTFIHGVGNGTLKDTIIEKIKDYEELENQSASLAKFGVGAIDVIFRYKP